MDCLEGIVTITPMHSAKRRHHLEHDALDLEHDALASFWERAYFFTAFKQNVAGTQMPHSPPIDCRAGGRHSSSLWRSRGARTAALLASCCIPSAAGFAQTSAAGPAQNCPPAPSHPLATTLATIKVGDYWIYEQNGTLTVPASATSPTGAPPGGPPSGGPIPLTGTFVEHVELRAFQGTPTLALVVVQNLTAGGVSIYGSNPAPEQIFYVEQDPATNNLLVRGDA